MVIAKVLSFVVASIATALLVRKMSAHMTAAKVHVKPDHAGRQPAKRLRQDPRTGIYYPEA